MTLISNTLNQDEQPSIQWTHIPLSSWGLFATYVLISLILCWQFILPFKAERHFRDGYNFFVNMRYKWAIEELELAVKCAPWETHYQIQLGKAYEKQINKEKDPDTKKELLSKSEKNYLLTIKLDDNNPWYRNRLATIYQKLAIEYPGKQNYYLNLAENEIKTAALLDTNNPLFQLNLAYFLHQQGQTEIAKPYYKRVIDIDKSLLEAPYNLADIYRQANDIDNALYYYEMVNTINPNFGNTDLALANLYILQEKYAIAEPYAEKAIMKFPNEPDLIRNLAAIHHRNGDWDKVIELYPRLLKLRPNEREFHQYYIQALVNKNALKKAISKLKIYLKKHPKDPIAIDQLKTLNTYIINNRDQ